MHFKTGPAVVAGLAGLLLATPAALAASDASGVWVDDKGRGAIEIKDCGGKLCGHVVWTRDAADASRGCGKQIIGDAVAQGGGVWDGGWIYNPDKKKRYDVELKPLSDGTLRVKGYAGTKLFSRTMVWTKAPADLKRCDAVSEANADAGAVKADTQPAAASAPVAQAAVPARKPAAPAASTPAATSGSAALLRAPAQASEPDEALSAPKEEAPDVKSAVREMVGKIASSDGGDDPLQSLNDKIEEMAPGKGYGIKETDDGNCRINVPFVKLTVKCRH